MRKIPLLFFLFSAILFVPAASYAQTAQNTETVMILPFENTSGKSEFNWVGESFADALSDLLRVPALNVVANDQRKLIQQKLKVPLTSLPSLATSLKLAREGQASLLIAGKYTITPAQGDAAASLTVTSKIIRVNEGRFLDEELPGGKKIVRDITLTDALSNLQTVEGQLAYQILYQRDKSLPFSQNQFVDQANKVPARAFEAYIKGLLTPESGLQSRENYFKNALRLYTEAKPNETYADAALELGHFYLNQKQNQNAVDYFSRVSTEVQRCLEESEKNRRTGQCNNAIYAEAIFYTALIYWQQNDYEQALAVLRPLAEDLKLTSVYNTLGAISIEAARAEKKNKGKSDALLKDGLDFLQKAAESATPEESAPRFNYGLALFLSGDYKAAADQFRPVLAANQRDGESYYLLAKALDKSGNAGAGAEFDNNARKYLINYAKVETDFQKNQAPDEIKLRVEQPLRKDFMSVVLTRGQAANQVQIPVNETDALLAQAREYYKNNRDDDAMQILRRVLASEPMSAQAYFILGNIHLRRGDLDQASSSLKTALFWDNRLLDAHIALGKIFIEKRDCLQAQNYAASAANLAPDNEEVAALKRGVERCSK